MGTNLSDGTLAKPVNTANVLTITKLHAASVRYRIEGEYAVKPKDYPAV